MTRPKRVYATIDERTARQIRELHRRHPRLGHHGLFDLLEQAGTHIDREELDQFLRTARIRPESPGHYSWGQVGAVWTWAPGILGDGSAVGADANGDGGDGD